MQPLLHGHTPEASLAPAEGELIDEIARMGDVVIEQILSGALDRPKEFDQDHDEWVILLDGGADLEVAGEELSMSPGDWVLLLRHTPHRLVRTIPGSRWLAVHVASVELSESDGSSSGR